MSEWRVIFGFRKDEDLSFSEVHDRYRQKILTFASPIGTDDLRRLNDALEAARAELGTSRLPTRRS